MRSRVPRAAVLLLLGFACSRTSAADVDPLAPVGVDASPSAPDHDAPVGLIDPLALPASDADAAALGASWAPASDAGGRAGGSDGPMPEAVRAIWVVRDALADPVPERIVASAHELGANTLFVQVSGRGDAWYDSSILPRAEGLPAAQGDPFARVLDAAARLGISVHAWINVALVWSAPDPPKDPEHLVHRRPDWIACLPDGAPMTAVPRDSLHAWFVEGLFAELAHADYRAHVAAVAREILERYPAVDGIHLDYIRRPVIDVGYDVATVGRFVDRTGYAAWDVMPASAREAADAQVVFAGGVPSGAVEGGTYAPRDLRHRPGGGAWYVSRPGRPHAARPFRWPDYGEAAASSPAAREWNRYRREAVTLAVAAVRTQVEAVSASDGRPRVLTAAVIPDPDRAHARFAQDWALWVASGLLDYVVPMCYARGRDAAGEQLTAVLSAAAPGRVIAGAGAFQQPLGTCALTLRDMLERDVRGVCIFSWTSLDEKRDERTAGLVRRAWMPVDGLAAVR